MKKLIKNYPLILFFACILVLLLATRINVFRYTNFDYGKFDLGNMTQMVWNTLNGRFLYLTDYFGANLPRWAMSHVDPILILFVPIFAIFQTPMTLVISQLVLVIFSAFLIYKIASLELKNDFAALLMALAFLTYPSIGFLLAWTGFHGVTVAIPFFLGAFYVFEKMYKEKSFSTKGWILFWILSVIAMSGKEEISLFFLMFGVFTLLFRKGVSKVSWSLIGVGLLWFVVAFFVIIPKYAHFRVDGYAKFAENLSIDSDLSNSVTRENYFLSRYESYGDSYSEVFLNMLKQPQMLVRDLFSGDKPENMRMTFDPMLYSSFLYPPLLAMALPELLINYSVTGGGIGTSEIYNHRISMIIPVLFIASIYGFSYVSKLFSKKDTRKRNALIAGMAALLLAGNIFFTFEYGNPIYLWLTQAIQKRIDRIAFARPPLDEQEALAEGLEIGTRFRRMAKFENKDRECAQKVVDMVPEGASISGPDYLGAHLSMRETYAIFPALSNEADYVIVDIFAQKVVNILGARKTLINDVVGKIIKDENYKLRTSCGNLFVFTNVGPHGKSLVLPLQEKFSHDEKVDFEIYNGLYVVDYSLPDEITRGEAKEAQMVYTVRDSKSLDGFVMYMTFLNKQSGEVYQLPNLPSFGLTRITDWDEGYYYVENLELVIPEFAEKGDYRIFVGLSNKIRTRDVYLGDIKVN